MVEAIIDVSCAEMSATQDIFPGAAGLRDVVSWTYETFLGSRLVKAFHGVIEALGLIGGIIRCAVGRWVMCRALEKRSSRKNFFAAGDVWSCVRPKPS